MLDHLGLQVSDYEDSKRFFAASLAPLGYEILAEFGGATAGFGAPPKPDFWIARGQPSGAAHVAFRCEDRATVDAFHRAGLAAGGKDNGAPGLRPIYHEHYYGAFVLDPDGHNIEAVCHRPEQA